MLSVRARNVLAVAGFNLGNREETRRHVRAALLIGVRWKNCGRKTVRELQRWVDEPAEVSAVTLAMNDALIERGAVSFLESKGYKVIPPDPDKNKYQCPDCAQLVLHLDRIDGLRVCVSCWEKRYLAKSEQEQRCVLASTKLLTCHLLSGTVTTS